VADAIEIAYFPRPPRPWPRAPTTSPSWRVRSPPPTTPSGSSRSAMPRASRHDRRLRHGGGIQALRTSGTSGVHLRRVRVAQFITTLENSTPIAGHVKVDLELRGCPISKAQLLEAVCALLNHRKPVLPTYSVCVECKQRETPCVMVSQGIRCLGPVTQAGCNALCPPTTGAASAASADGKPRIRPPCRALDRAGCRPRHRRPCVPHLQRVAEPFRKESEAQARRRE